MNNLIWDTEDFHNLVAGSSVFTEGFEYRINVWFEDEDTLFFGILDSSPELLAMDLDEPTQFLTLTEAKAQCEKLEAGWRESFKNENP